VPTRTLQLTDSESPTPIPTLDISQGEILFSVYPNGEIRSLNLDGRILETLVNPSSSVEINNDRHANWLPDGSEISYTVDDFGQAEIWVMDDDGGNQHYLIGDVATGISGMKATRIGHRLVRTLLFQPQMMATRIFT